MDTIKLYSCFLSRKCHYHNILKFWIFDHCHFQRFFTSVRIRLSPTRFFCRLYEKQKENKITFLNLNEYLSWVCKIVVTVSLLLLRNVIEVQIVHRTVLAKLVTDQSTANVFVCFYPFFILIFFSKWHFLLSDTPVYSVSGPSNMTQYSLLLFLYWTLNFVLIGGFLFRGFDPASPNNIITFEPSSNNETSVNEETIKNDTVVLSLLLTLGVIIPALAVLLVILLYAARQKLLICIQTVQELTLFSTSDFDF